MKFSFTAFFFLLTLMGFSQRVSSTHFYYFDSGSSSLKANEEKKLSGLCDTLKTLTVISIQITGHTDDTGGEEENMELSEKRAESIRKSIMQKGVPSDIISVAAMGEQNPIENNANAKGRSRNRRVEVKVVWK